MTQIKGVVIYQFATKKGTWIQLKSKTWVYVPEVIPSSLIGAYVKFEGQKKNYREKSFFYSNRYEILQDFDFQKVMQKLMLYLEKNDFKAKSLLNLQTVVKFFTYLFVFGKFSLIQKISKWTKEKIISYCKSPYLLFLNNHANFHVADVLAQALMIDESERIYPLSCYLLDVAYKKGKECVSVDELFKLVSERLSKPLSKEDFINKILQGKKIVIVDDMIYLGSVYFMRKKCLEILFAKNIPSLTCPTSIPEALKSIIRWKYSVITGKPGTGKTTLVKQLKDSSLKVIFTATTGKAAKVLDESAITLHDLLGFSPQGFRTKSVDADVVVIDEASMLTWRLLYNALKIIKGKIILVGDPEQAAPVNAPAVFNEVINHMPNGSVIKLETVYRTVNHKRYIMNVSREQAFRKISNMAEICEKYGYDWQIITPYKVTVSALNKYIQKKLRGNGNMDMFKKGDKVMFVKNLSFDGILIASNGQTGRVVDRDGEYYVVKFKDSIINCKEDELMLAYACTIHKVQGSEYDYVICYIPKGVNEEFLSDDLILVASTRGKRKTCFVCEDDEIVKKIQNICNDVNFM